MKTIFTFRPNRLWRPALVCVAAFAIMAGTSSCESSGTYWGVDQSYPVGNGQLYYGAYGGDGPYRHHHHDKKRYKKYRKEQKKWAKKQAKYRKKQMKEARKHHRRHHHHDDD